MQTHNQSLEEKTSGTVPVMEFACESCHLIQRYRGKSHARCIYCGRVVKKPEVKTRVIKNPG